MLQFQANNDSNADKTKIFVFILKPETDLDIFFVKNEYAGDVLQQLKILTSFEEKNAWFMPEGIEPVPAKAHQRTIFFNVPMGHLPSHFRFGAS